MANSTKTKFYTSDMAGAPVLNGTRGSLNAVLRAVLDTGFGAGAVASLVVAGGVATATYASGHSFVADAVGTFAGATPSALNGEKRITGTGPNWVKFAAPGVPDGAATGGITSKVTAAGWSRPFFDGDVFVFKMIDPEGTGFCLRVDDSEATVARVRGYEAMTDAHTGTGAFPTVAQAAGTGLYWSRSNEASAVAREWRIFGDSRGFYFCVRNLLTAEFQGAYFGDITSLKSNDPYACVLRAMTANRSGTVGTANQDFSTHDPLGAYDGAFIARESNALGGAVRVFNSMTYPGAITVASVIGAAGWPYPAPVDNGLLAAPLIIHTPAAGPRGYLPGLYAAPQVCTPAFDTGNLLPGSGDVAGQSLYVMQFGAKKVTTPAGCATCFMNHTGDWR